MDVSQAPVPDDVVMRPHPLLIGTQEVKSEDVFPRGRAKVVTMATVLLKLHFPPCP